MKPNGSGDEGTIATNGTLTSTVFGYGGAIITQTAGTISSGAGGFNMNGGATWNISGGSITGRYIIANGATNIINISGGSLVLTDHPSTQHMGVANGGNLNISGSAVLDGTFATAVVQTGGNIDIATGWTGSWTYNGNDLATWETLFTSGNITSGGATIDAGTFNSNYAVTGNTLTAIPEPSSTALLGLGTLALLLRRRK